MKNILQFLLSLILFMAMPCSADSLAENQSIVAGNGITEVAVTLGKSNLLIKIITHEMDIGKPSDGWPKKRLTSCTYSRYPCNLIDSIGIAVNGKDLFLARSIYSDLADIAIIEVSIEEGRFLLTMLGGDASESYKVKIYFDNKNVYKRKILSNFNGQITQETIYYPSFAMD